MQTIFLWQNCNTDIRCLFLKAEFLLRPSLKILKVIFSTFKVYIWENNKVLISTYNAVHLLHNVYVNCIVHDNFVHVITSLSLVMRNTLRLLEYVHLSMISVVGLLNWISRSLLMWSLLVHNIWSTELSTDFWIWLMWVCTFPDYQLHHFVLHCCQHP